LSPSGYQTWSGLIDEGTSTGETVYLGSRQSQTLLRIYDKRLQMQAQERLDWQEYGIRWELELKQDRTTRWAKEKPVDGPWMRWEMERKRERTQAVGLALLRSIKIRFRIHRRGLSHRRRFPGLHQSGRS
jgi:DNA relaxase NicK